VRFGSERHFFPGRASGAKLRCSDPNLIRTSLFLCGWRARCVRVRVRVPGVRNATPKALTACVGARDHQQILGAAAAKLVLEEDELVGEGEGAVGAARKVDHGGDGFERDFSVTVRELFAVGSFEAQGHAELRSVDAEQDEARAASVEAARGAQELLARRAMDEAFAREAVCLVRPRLERRGECATLGDVKDVARGNPSADRRSLELTLQPILLTWSEVEPSAVLGFAERSAAQRRQNGTNPSRLQRRPLCGSSMPGGGFRRG
jgi:hypothetical protein